LSAEDRYELQKGGNDTGDSEVNDRNKKAGMHSFGRDTEGGIIENE
jgi:hypothetical protein